MAGESDITLEIVEETPIIIEIGETGPAGSEGPPGNFINLYEAAWNSGTTYAEGAIVTYQGSSWLQTDLSSLNEVPGVAPNWDLIASKGDIGATGATGATGAKGDQGDPGVVQSVVAGNKIDVDSTDPANPVVALEALTKSDVGLGNVDNTSDLNKPISTATQTALDAKKTDSMTTERLLGRGTAGTGVIEEIIVGSNLSLDGTTLNAADGRGRVPIGIISMWSGLIADIPGDWAFCNGTDNSPGPDLRDKFVVGATQDDGGEAKTNIEGTLKQTGGVTGHSHSAHADLTHAGGAVGDHTGLTHSLAVANHPDLTHVALSHPARTLTQPNHTVPSSTGSNAAQTLTHGDHSVPSVSHTHASLVVTLADHSVASFSGTHASHTHAGPSMTSLALANDGSLTLSLSSQGTARTIMTRGTTDVVVASHSHASITGASGTHTHAAITLAHTDPTIPSFSGTGAGFTLTHGDHSVPSASHTHASAALAHADISLGSYSHQDIGTHKGTDYGVHSITQPADHGSAGTLTHAFTQPNIHTISAHDTVLSIPNYYALAYIQCMA